MNQSSGSSDYITILNPNDVLFGRGSGPNDHEGNIRFRSLVSERKAEYMATNHRQTKAKIARDIVAHVINKNGRFLKKVEAAEAKRLGIPKGVDAWISVDDETIMEKAKQALRQQRDKGKSRSPNSSPIPAARKTIQPSQVESYVAANARFAAAGDADASRRTSHMQNVAAELNSAYAQAQLHPNPYEPIPIGSNALGPDNTTLSDWRNYTTAAIMAQTQGIGQQQQNFAGQPTPQLDISNVAGLMSQPAARPPTSNTRRDMPDSVSSRRESIQVADLMDSFNKMKTKELGGNYSSDTIGTIGSRNNESTDTMGTIEPLPVGPGANPPLASSLAMSSSTFSLMKGALQDSSRATDSAMFKSGALGDSAAIDPSIFKSQEGLSHQRGSISSRAGDRRASRGSININDKDFFKNAVGKNTSSDLSNMSMSLSQVWNEKRTLKDVTEGQDEDNDESQKKVPGAPREVLTMEDDPDNMSGLGKSSMSILNVAMGESQGESIMTANESIFSDIGD